NAATDTGARQEMNAQLRKFIFNDLQAVEGYIDPPDALVFLSLLQAQTKAGMGGGIAEIGVFYGRSYYLMKKIVGDAGRILAIDLFDLGGDGAGAPTQYQRFLDYGRRLGLAVDEDLIIMGDSTG